MQATQVAKPAAPAERPSYVGVVTSRRFNVITADFRGRVDKLFINSGQRVKAGDPIAKLDSTELSAKLEAAKASAASARGAVGAAGVAAHAAQMKYQNELRLVSVGASAPSAAKAAAADYGESQGRGGEASGKLAEALVTIKQTEDLLKHATVVAPLDGLVTQIKVKEGVLAEQGTPIARIFDTSDLVVQFAVPQEDVDDIKLAQRVELHLDGTDQVVWATVEKIDPAQEPPVNFAVVLADIDDSKLKPDEVRVTSIGRVRIPDQVADARGAKR